MRKRTSRRSRPSQPSPPQRDEATEGTGSNLGQTGKPCIIAADRQLLAVIDDAWQAVRAANDPPQVFRRYQALVRLHDGEQGPEIRLMDEHDTYALLTRIAVWAKRRAGGQVVDAFPPRPVARDMMTVPSPSLPVLEGVVTIPVFSRAGVLISSSGYHRGERLFLALPETLEGLDVPASPAPDDIARARSLLLDELLGDFPFVDQGSRAHAVAAILLPFLRQTIAGPTPLHLIEAPTPGSGKGLLRDAIAVIATGRRAAARTLAVDEDECRKMIASELATGRPIILLDNTRQYHVLDSAPLASVVTADRWTDRLLGRSKMVTLPNRALWLINGNNPSLSAELARRAIRIRLDPQMDRPWLRQAGEFRHPDLIGWASAHRGELVWAALVLTRAWVVAGRPRPPTGLGSFEQWSDVIGGVLMSAGIPGFLEGLEALYEGADIEGDAWREFTTAWWAAFGNQPKRVADLRALSDREDLMLEVRGDGSERSQETRLGHALRQARGRVFGDLRVTPVPDPRGRISLYALERVQTRASRPGAGPAGPTSDLDDEGPASQNGNLGSSGQTSQLSSDGARPARPLSRPPHEITGVSSLCERGAEGLEGLEGLTHGSERPQEASGCAGPVPDLGLRSGTGPVGDDEEGGDG